MPAGYAAAFAALKSVFSGLAPRLAVLADTDLEYTLTTQKPSPFPQHKGQPMWFGSVRLGKSYVSLHLMPLYMSLAMHARITGGLQKRMQGNTCFNFRKPPDAEALAALATLAKMGFEEWRAKGWT